MPFERDAECQFLKIDMRDKSLDVYKKIRPVEKDSISCKVKGMYKKSALISNKRVLLFTSKEVLLIDISDKNREEPIKLAYPSPDLSDIHRVIMYMA